MSGASSVILGVFELVFSIQVVGAQWLFLSADRRARNRRLSPLCSPKDRDCRALTVQHPYTVN